MGIKEIWLKSLKEEGLKFFVLKAEDFFEVLSDKEIELFNLWLMRHEEYRINKGKTPYNEYYLVNKDDVPHLKTKEEFFKAVGYKVK